MTGLKNCLAEDLKPSICICFKPSFFLFPFVFYGIVAMVTEILVLKQTRNIKTYLSNELHFVITLF